MFNQEFPFGRKCFPGAARVLVLAADVFLVPFIILHINDGRGLLGLSLHSILVLEELCDDPHLGIVANVLVFSSCRGHVANAGTGPSQAEAINKIQKFAADNVSIRQKPDCE